MRRERNLRVGLLAAAVLGTLAVAAPAAAAEAPRLADAAQHQDKAAITALLKEKSAVNAAQPDGTTALHWAVHWRDAASADLLIRAGANVNAKNDYGATPLSLACNNGDAAMVAKVLAAGANPNLAAEAGVTPLMQCARTGNADAVEALLAHKADVNAKDSDQRQTALMWAVAESHPKIADILVRNGADVRARSKGGFSPLLFAARAGDVDSGKVLLAAGADVNETDPSGMTPLVLASASGREKFGVFLLDKGANPNARDGAGATALHYALMRGITSLNGIRYANYAEHLFRPTLMELLRALVAHKADPNIPIERRIGLGGGKSADLIGATSLMLAAATPDPETMRILVKAGANPKLTTKSGLTVLMLAAGANRGQDFTDEEKRVAADAVRVALDLGADVNASSEAGITALHGAAANGADDVVRLLAAKGANLNARDGYQETPLSIATGERLPWIPEGEEMGEIIQPSTRDLLLKLGATPLNTPGYFHPPSEDSDAYRYNRGVRGLDKTED